MLVFELNGHWFESRRSYLNFKYHACFEQEFLDIQRNTESGLPLKHFCDMIRISSQMHSTEKKLTTHINHLVILAKWLSIPLGTKWPSVQVPLQSPKL